MPPGARGSLRQRGFSPGPPRVPRPPRLQCTGAGVDGKGVRSADAGGARSGLLARLKAVVRPGSAVRTREPL